MTKDNHPLDFLQLFLRNDVIDSIIKHCVRYATLTLHHDFLLTREEMCAFLGVLYLSGYVPVPRRRMLWENSDDTQNKAVVNALRRNRFEEIFRFLHVCDNERLDANDKFAKVRPFLTDLNEAFLRNAPYDTDVSVDESMIPYFGRYKCKQFLRLKPVRFGYKAWVAASKGGYCLNVDLYQGKAGNNDREPGVGLGEHVLKFVDELTNAFPSVKLSFFR